ncbi:hypothetical protein ACFSRY_12290 [Pontibacter locisalis]|uniref:Glycine zipper domain-containing protein n=1 Tax=Pontibacter locisalis TaxID=1719035 RepID=A0ABW5ILZ9_9BACT
MKTVLALLLCCIATVPLKAQATSPVKSEYLHWLYLKDSRRALKGVIIEANDSSILFLDNFTLSKNKKATYTPQLIPVSSVEKIKYRKRKDFRKGLLLGGLGGAATGAVAGYADGDDECGPGTWCIVFFTAEDKAVLGAVLGVIPGMAIGALVGSSKKTIFINGNQDTYNLSREELKQYTLAKN